MTFLGLSSAIAVEPKAPTEIKITKKTDRTEVNLSQQAERMEARNRIMVKLTVEARGNNARQIQAEINKRMSAAIKKASDNHNITVETGSYSVSRPYDSQSGKDADRWRGTQTLTLTSDNFEAVLNLSGLLQSDGLVMSDMRFFVAPETLKAAQDELTTAAIKTLKERTNKVAKDIGLKFERFKNVNIGNVSEEYDDSGRKGGKSVGTITGKSAPPSVVAGYALVTLKVSATAIMSE
jgi:predicted secreted protein